MYKTTALIEAAYMKSSCHKTSGPDISDACAISISEVGMVTTVEVKLSLGQTSARHLLSCQFLAQLIL
jgi:hypothetical protein